MGLRVILLGEYPGLFRWAQSNHEGTMRGRQEGQSQRGHGTPEAVVSGMPLLEGDHELRKADSL